MVSRRGAAVRRPWYVDANRPRHVLSCAAGMCRLTGADLGEAGEQREGVYTDQTLGVAPLSTSQSPSCSAGPSRRNSITQQANVYEVRLTEHAAALAVQTRSKAEKQSGHIAGHCLRRCANHALWSRVHTAGPLCLMP